MSLELLEGGSTGDNVDQLVGNDGLTGSVVKDRVLADHVVGVLGGVVHGVSTSGNFGSMTLSKTPEDVVGEGEFGKVLKDLVFDFVKTEFWRGFNGLLGEGWQDGWLERDTRDELVVHDLDFVVFLAQLGDLVSDQGSLVVRGGLLANVGDGQDQVLWVGSRELGLGLFTDSDKVSFWLILEVCSGSSGQLGVDRTTETLVRGHDNQETLGRFFWLGSLSLVEDLLLGSTVGTGDGHGTLGLVETGGSHNLHGVGDLLNVLNGLETSLNFSESGIVSTIIMVSL